MDRSGFSSEVGNEILLSCFIRFTVDLLTNWRSIDCYKPSCKAPFGFVLKSYIQLAKIKKFNINNKLFLGNILPFKSSHNGPKDKPKSLW